MKFKVGQKVACYDNSFRWVSTVVEITGTGNLVTQAGNASRMLLHPKQCRLLVKKKRMSFWIDMGRMAEGVSMNTLYRRAYIKDQPDKSCLEFREVKKK